jgi:hypothetical protein
MNAIKFVAILLIAAGIVGAVYGGFSYTTQAVHEAEEQMTHMSIEERERFNMPLWTGVGALLIGGALLVFDGRKR